MLQMSFHNLLVFIPLRDHQADRNCGIVRSEGPRTELANQTDGRTRAHCFR